MSIAASPAWAYDKATVTNNTPFDADVKIDYAACRSDSFRVSAGRTAQPTASRGACLITSITASLAGHGGATAYTSSGTSYSVFVIQDVPQENIGYRVWSDHELSDELNKTPTPPFDNGQKKRPFYIIGHNPNQIPIPGNHPKDWTAEDEALGDLTAGANALEPDIMKFSDKAVFGTTNIDHYADKSGLFIYHDSVLATTHMPATVEQYMKYVHDLAVQQKFSIVLLTIDVKPPAFTYGKALVTAVHENLYKDGFRPFVMYNTGNSSANDPTAKTFFTDIVDMLDPNEGICMDGTRDPVSVFNTLTAYAKAGSKGNFNIAYGTGGQGFTSGSFPHVSLSVDQATWVRVSQGLNASIPYVYPVPGKGTAAGVDWWGSFMDSGIDGLIPDLDVNPAPPGSTRAQISALKAKVEASSVYYLAKAADNPFTQGRDGYALRVDTGHNATNSAGTDGYVTFTLTGSNGSASAIFNGRTSVGSETRFHDSGRDYLVIPSKDLGQLKNLRIYVSGSGPHSWDVKSIQIASGLYNIPYTGAPEISINQTVSSASPITVDLSKSNLGRP